MKQIHSLIIAFGFATIVATHAQTNAVPTPPQPPAAPAAPPDAPPPPAPARLSAPAYSRPARCASPAPALRLIRAELFRRRGPRLRSNRASEARSSARFELRTRQPTPIQAAENQV